MNNTPCRVCGEGEWPHRFDNPQSDHAYDPTGATPMTDETQQETWTCSWPQGSLLFGGLTEWLIKNERGELVAKVYDKETGDAIIIAHNDAPAKDRTIAAAREAIPRLQWVSVNGGTAHACRGCGNLMGAGHAVGCFVALALAQLDATVGAEGK